MTSRVQKIKNFSSFPILGYFFVFNYSMTSVAELAECGDGLFLDVIIQFGRRLIVINLDVIFVSRYFIFLVRIIVYGDILN